LALRGYFFALCGKLFLRKSKLFGEMPKVPKLPKMPKVNVFYLFYENGNSR
jgi:hypothetical protein